MSPFETSKGPRVEPGAQSKFPLLDFCTFFGACRAVTLSAATLGIFCRSDVLSK